MNINEIPNEILCHIFSFIPLSCAQIRKVNHHFMNIIDTQFVNKHIAIHHIMADQTVIVRPNKQYFFEWDPIGFLIQQPYEYPTGMFVPDANSYVGYRFEPNMIDNLTETQIKQMCFQRKIDVYNSLSEVCAHFGFPVLLQYLLMNERKHEYQQLCQYAIENNNIQCLQKIINHMKLLNHNFTHDEIIHLSLVADHYNRTECRMRLNWFTI